MVEDEERFHDRPEGRRTPRRESEDIDGRLEKDDHKEVIPSGTVK